MTLRRQTLEKFCRGHEKKLLTYFQKNCSLFEKRNPCKCSEQLDYLANLGLIKPGDMNIRHSSLGTIRTVLGNTINDIEDSYSRFLTLYQEQPFFKGPDMVAWLRDLLQRNNVNEIFFIKN